MARRSSRGGRHRQLARPCWPIREAILRVVRPGVVLVHGAVTLELLLDRSESLGDEEGFSCGYPHLGSCRIVQVRLADRLTTVIGLPHLSYWAINSKTSADALERIRAAYGQALDHAERDDSGDPSGTLRRKVERRRVRG